MSILYVDVNGAAGSGASPAASTNVVPTTVAANTSVLFNSDNGIQTMPFRVNSLSVSGNNVTIGSYGSGRAVVSGFQQFTGGWTLNSGTVCQRSWTPASGQFGAVINMSDTTGSAQGTVLNWGNATDGTIVPATLPSGYYAYDATGDIMYVNLGVNLATVNAKTFGFGACARFITVPGGATPTTVEVSNLRVMGFGNAAINVVQGASHWHVHDNELYANGGFFTGTVYEGTGIQCGGNANNIEIDNNLIQQTFDSPISPQHFNGSSGEVIDSIHIHHNTIQYWALAAIEIADWGSGNTISNVEVNNNVATGGGQGFSALGHSGGSFTDGCHMRGGSLALSGISIHDNTFNGYTSGIAARNGTASDDVLVYNNRLSSANYGIYNSQAGITIGATNNSFCNNATNDVHDVNQTPNTLINGGTYSGNTTSATQCITPPIASQGVQTQTVALSLLAASGTYNYSLATAFAGYILDSNSTTFAYAGNPATFLYSAFSIAAGAGSYTYTGKDAVLAFALNPSPLTAASGTYSYTGNDATFTLTPATPYLVADAGVYSMSGKAATLTRFIPGRFPNVVGLTVQMAQQSLEAAGALNPTRVGYFGNWPVSINWVQNGTSLGTLMNPGIVVAQSPAAGSVIHVNAPIVLTVNEVPVSLATPPSQANF